VDVRPRSVHTGLVLKRDMIRHRIDCNCSGYHAVGTIVTLVAIVSSRVVDLVTADLAYKTERVKHLLCIIKMCALLPLLRTLLGSREGSEFDKIIR
jgi:hypothetical protein